MGFITVKLSYMDTNNNIFHFLKHHCFAQKHFRFLLQALPNERCYNCTGARLGAPSPRIAIIYLPHHRLNFYPVNQYSVLETDRIPIHVLRSSCDCANLPDGCWSAKPHHGYSKAEF
ncbi:hypothetical protein Tsp_12397 [Trichinella spiralis]|uniref:hypothetical protein n=1 Tax=Trichinella spiralis TaxID=6334 RepID=UPI0001EFDE41|nr:hypothetical protein Tsp_12397 [Trichinella spiralis]